MRETEARDKSEEWEKKLKNERQKAIDRNNRSKNQSRAKSKK